MRRCHETTRPLQLRLQPRQGLQVSPRPQTLRYQRYYRPQRPAVTQFSNAELLNLLGEIDDAVQTGTTHSITQRKHNQSQPLPVSFLDLPESPVTSQRLLQARTGHRAQKPPPSKERTAFQSRLQKNPFAYALATSPRLCLLTGLRFPSYFQIHFGLAIHPKTGAPWHLPTLETESTSSKSSEASPETSVDGTTSSSPQSTSTTKRKTLPSSRELTRTAAGTHFIASRRALKEVSGLSLKLYRHMLPFHWKDDPNIKVLDVIWRQDMDTFVLELLRKNALNRLIYLASRPAAYVADCSTHEKISEHKQVGAILWLGPNSQDQAQEHVAKTGSGSASPPQYSGPPLYAMHHYQSRYVPVYNMPTLLGTEHLRTLRNSSSLHYGCEYAVIKARRNTIPVQSELWKLLGYQVGYEDEAMKAKEVYDGTEFSQEFEMDAIPGDERFSEPLANILADR